MKVTILGCGTSSGVPRIGNEWGDCDPAEPRNRRRRASILVEHEGTTVLVDTGPDFREQMLDAGVRHLDAVLYTHDHADHAHGLDDLRQIFHLSGRPVDCYASPETWAVLRSRFGYVFDGTANYPRTCNALDLPPRLVLGGLTITGFRQNHGDVDTTGYRFETGRAAMAYSTDIKDLPAESSRAVAGLDLWIVDALRRKPHPTHSHLDRTLGWIAANRPSRALLTHLDHSMDYRTLVAELPDGVAPAHDGLVVEL